MLGVSAFFLEVPIKWETNNISWPKPGSGRPRGSPNKDQPFRDALRMEIAALQAEDHNRRLRRMARALIEKAAAGDVAAIKEVADWLDGKSPQGIGRNDELSPVGIIVTGVLCAGDRDHRDRIRTLWRVPRMEWSIG
jgi:hypothetical protein